ncbi:MAG: J domain-containing protein [SAR324 cluster bacterium]|nr:J domain-containing protein [SAR324 cluster bacterium]
MINYYETLRLDPSADAEDIKGAYRQLAKRFHPDVAGGDPVRFARICDAYEVLSDPNRRKRFDGVFRASQADQEFNPRGRGFRPPRPARPAQPRGLGPPFTRLMSLTVERGGRFMMEGLTGKFVIDPTHKNALWETTLRKFGDVDRQALARKVIQIRLKGPREVVRKLRPAKVDYGVQFKGRGSAIFGEDAFGAAFDEIGSASVFNNPHVSDLHQIIDAKIELEATVPEGVPIYLYDMSGDIAVGDQLSELFADLDGAASLKAGRISSADITLRGASKAHITHLMGSGDLIVLGAGKLLVGGKIDRLRVVVEQEAHVEVIGTVAALQASVSGRGYLHVKGTVDVAHCDVRAGGYAKMAKVTHSLTGSRSGGAALDVLEPPPNGNRSATSQFGFR